MEWLWAALAIAFLVVELNTQRLVAVWVSVSAAFIMVIKAIFPDLRLVWQGLIFLGLSVLLILISYPITKKLFDKEKEKNKKQREQM